MNQSVSTATSPDGLPIAYEASGTGPQALVFVHGWCCNRGFWRSQTEHFANSFQVIAMDLGGHGDSGKGRETWSMPAFGADVAAVLRQLQVRKAILVGHSMGGAVIVEAARQAPDVVKRLVGVETFWDVSASFSRQVIEARLEPFRIGYLKEAEAYVRGMFLESADPSLVERTVRAMTSVPEAIGFSALEEVSWNGENQRRGIEEIKVPIHLINSSDWRPTNTAAAARYGIETRFLEGTGHFLMLDDALRFNSVLNDVLGHLDVEGTSE